MRVLVSLHGTDMETLKIKYSTWAIIHVVAWLHLAWAGYVLPPHPHLSGLFTSVCTFQPMWDRRGDAAYCVNTTILISILYYEFQVEFKT